MNGVKLLIAYRLHFDRATLRAIELARSGALGRLRYFTSTFSHDVPEGNIRRRPKMGGGALFDLGVYCTNAARSIFGEEPTEAYAAQCPALSGHDVDQTTAALLRFSDDRVAQFTASQETPDADSYTIGGTRGVLRVEPGFRPNPSRRARKGSPTSGSWRRSSRARVLDIRCSWRRSRDRSAWT
jgi:predicted dehydrogenase